VKFHGIGFVLLWAVLASGQATQLSQGSTPPSAASQSKDEHEKKEREIKNKEQSRRVLGVVPQFAVTDRKDAPPLSAAGKFQLFRKSAFDPVEFGLVGLEAGLSQAQNEFPSYGQGAEGYAKRYGAAFADEVSTGFWSNFFWASVLKEDPRYFRLGEGGFKRRFFYALKQEVVCHTDKGGRSFSFENALGALSSGGLSNAYYPQDDRGLELTMSRSGIAVLYGSLGGVVDEFWPDVQRKLFHKRRAEQAPKIP
jgi:hypothetical protein